MKINDAFPSSTFSAADFADSGPRVLTIKSCEMKTLGMGDDVDTKPVLAFDGVEKTIVLNKSRWNACEEMFGAADSDAWIGRQVEAFAGRTNFKGKMVACVSLRAPSKADVPF